jgi:hypothetical protein
MVLSLLVLLLLLPEVPGLSADLEVRAEMGLVTVRARAVPLNDVLQRFCLQTGTELVYEGPQPSPLISVSLKDVPEAEVPTRLLEGLGLNYAYETDATGRRVKTLIIGETFGSGPAGGASRPSPATRFGRPFPAFRRGVSPPAIAGEEQGSPTDDSFDASPPPGEGGPPFTPGASPEGMARPVFPGDPSHPRPGLGSSPF